MANMTFTGTSASVQATWVTWNNVIVCNTSSLTSGTSNNAWLTWNTAVTNGTNGTVTIQSFVDGAWAVWNDIQFTATGNGRVVGVRQLRELTSEQKEQQRLAQEKATRQAQEEAEMRAIADEKAKVLLVEHLSAEQQKTYEEKKYFDVDIEGRIYRIHHGSYGNVRLLGTGDKAGKEVTKFCIQPEGVPLGDVLLAQKLLLQCNEKEFLRIANATQLV